jgi:hypothetical protein
MNPDDYFHAARVIKQDARHHALVGAAFYSFVGLLAGGFTGLVFVYLLALLFQSEPWIIPIGYALVVVFWVLGTWVNWRNVKRLELADGPLWLKTVEIGEEVETHTLEVWIWIEIFLIKLSRVVLLFAGWATVQAWRELRLWRAAGRVSESELAGAVAALLDQREAATVHDFVASMARPALVLTVLNSQAGVSIGGREVTRIGINDRLRAKWAG